MRPDFESIKNNAEIRTYITQADASLLALGYTEHSFPHVLKCAEVASSLLKELGYEERYVELARIAGYMHDIGNVINRDDHAQSGALMCFRILDRLGFAPEDTALVITAVGNHDEHTAYPVNAVAAALILADKTDVRRSRVRNRATISFDIHDRVNYSVERSNLKLDTKAKTLTLELIIDTTISSVMDYFEIFMTRMILCQKAAEYFGLTFRMNINGSVVL